MSILYDRQIEVTAAGLTISELRIAVSLDRQIDRTQDTGEVDIYNLNDQNEQRIWERGGPIRIVAGYPQTSAIIFDGEMQRVIRTREGLAKITKIKLGDQVRQRDRLGGTFSGSFAGPESVRRIALDIIGLGLGLPVGPLNNIPADATYTDFYWGGQPAASALDILLDTVDCTWFEADGVVRINKVGELQSDAPLITVSPETGLVGTPAATDEGAECRMFLNPAVQLGSLLTIENANLAGNWKVVGLQHRADNWDGDFVTFCDLRPV